MFFCSTNHFTHTLLHGVTPINLFQFLYTKRKSWLIWINDANRLVALRYTACLQRSGYMKFAYDQRGEWCVEDFDIEIEEELILGWNNWNDVVRAKTGD